MKIGIVGSRSIQRLEPVREALRLCPFTERDTGLWWQHTFVSGGADGVDTMAEHIATDQNVDIQVIEPDYSDWSGDEHPAKRRNTEIVEQSDAIVAVWNGKSNGTRDTINKALDRAKPLYVHIVEG